MSRGLWVVCFTCAFGVCLAFSSLQVSNVALAFPETEKYQTPYSVKLPWSAEELIPDILSGPRGEAQEESETPFREWNSPSLKKKLGSWGPRPRKFAPPEHANGKSPEWERARVIATALRYQGYAYRHHHIPDWNPPEGYHTPEKGETKHAGKGLDCSNFTSFIYNQGLGISLNSDVHKQAEITAAPVHGSSRTIRIRTIPGQGSVEEWQKALKPADLIYVRSNAGKISHVIMWLGEWGQSPDGTPLIIDSHGAEVKDSNGVQIPSGIRIRPFRPGSWYAKSSDHAHRILGE